MQASRRDLRHLTCMLCRQAEHQIIDPHAASLLRWRRYQHTAVDRQASVADESSMQQQHGSTSNSTASGSSAAAHFLSQAFREEEERNSSSPLPSATGGNSGPQSTAAAHLLAQARIEEADLSPTASISSRLLEAQRKEQPWLGDESIEDAVLRMLVDKYKPLRVPGHKRKIQEPSTEPIKYVSSMPVEEEEDPATRITDQSHPDYKWRPGDPPRYPWEHDFKGPSNQQGRPLIKTGVITRAPTITGRVPSGAVAARVFRARDASLDYRSGSTETAKAKVALGTKGGNTSYNQTRAAPGGYRPMPTNIKAWNSIVDERIELARQQGLFKNVKGRGKPFVRDPDESNPYVGRSEFLMNRIVKRQEAAPPFVEMQKEMRDEMNGFRARLRETWIRRATRMLSLQPITPSVIGECGEYRDSEWTARERGYHDTAVKNINNLIRKYNIVAPPTARALFTTVELELAACYKDCQPLIKEELERRVRAGMGTPRGAGVIQGPLRGPKGRIEAEEGAVKESMLSAFRRFVREVVGSKA